MRVLKLFAAGVAMAALFAWPGVSQAATTNRSSSQALRLMTDMRAEAAAAARQADFAEAGVAPVMTSWRTHAERLQRVKTAINKMGIDLHELQTIEPAVAPWEKKAIDQSAPLLREMANHTRDAILFLQQDRINLWMPEFQKFESSLDTESHDLARVTSEYVRYGKLHSSERQLARKLDIRAAS